jgi:hypothetical protein
MKLFVGNLSFSTTEDELRRLFEQLGEVVSASIVIDRETGRSRGFGFVEMASEEQARAAVEAMNGMAVKGRPLMVNEARPRETAAGGLSPQLPSGGGWGRGGDADTVPQSSNKKVAFTEVELTVDIPFEQFSDSDERRMLDSLRILLQTNAIRVVERRKGSTKIKLEIDWEYAESLLDSICRGDLTDFKVVDIEFLQASLAKAIVNRKRRDGRYDVFMCHNSQDKTEVLTIAAQLERRGLLPWIDEVDLKPGMPWQRAIEEQIERIGSVAVFIGSHGNGPWQTMEIEAFVREHVGRGSPVIPAILASSSEPKLPPFLNGMHRVDFRKERPSPIAQLVWGITGARTGTS